MVIVIMNLVALWMFTTLIQWMFFARGTSSKDNTDGRRASLFSTTRKGGKAIVQNEEEEDDNDDMDSATRFLSLASIRLLKQSTLSLSSSDNVVTVLLCGPANAGKTCIFHKLMMMHDANNKSNNKKLPLTLTSLKANVGVAHTDTVIQYIDWPGHALAAPNLLLSSSSSSSTIMPSSFVQQDPTLWQLWNDTLFSTSSRRQRLPSSSSSSSSSGCSSIITTTTIAHCLGLGCDTTCQGSGRHFLSIVGLCRLDEIFNLQKLCVLSYLWRT